MIRHCLRGVSSPRSQRLRSPSDFRPFRGTVAAASLAMMLGLSPWAQGTEVPGPQMLDPGLSVMAVTSGLNQPIDMAFLALGDFLVLEKSTGQVKRVINGQLQAQPVLDLAVNSASDRGLLSIALSPNFAATSEVLISYTESSTGADSNVVTEVPLRGNRVDRFIWTGTTLLFANNVIKYRALQTDNVDVPGHLGSGNGGSQRGNNDGGVIRFGPDGKLYLFMGDVGRRGWLQNLPNGPFTTGTPIDDAFGGPVPDDAHLTGAILRLNSDGSTPADNPFFAAGAGLGGAVGANVQKIYSYGHRNGFGMAFDPFSGALWATENGDDSFSELNRIVPGMNGGWIQIAGPINRMAQYKSIETTMFDKALQQRRYPPTRLAYTATLAASRMLMLPGAVYTDPTLSWKYDISPAGAAFITGARWGSNQGTLWLGAGRNPVGATDAGGSLFRVRITPDRLNADLSADVRLADRVADNLAKLDLTESETLLIGKGFGITPSLVMGPDGFLYVVSLTNGSIYRIWFEPS